MKKALLLFAALLVAGCGEKVPNDPEIKQALKNAVWGDGLVCGRARRAKVCRQQ